MNHLDIELYKTFSKKELVEWCILEINDNWNKIEPTQIQIIEWLYLIELWEEWYWYRIETDSLNFYCSKDIINVFDWKKMLRNSLDVDITIVGIEPHLEDIFRVAKEKWYLVEVDIFKSSFTKEYVHDFLFWKNWDNHSIRIIPEISILNQTDDTIQKLLNLFK